ncbi:MAG TPA: lipocalin family protein [Candidatus Kapabacteria bacterium]|nr:lipocalin family protein [Candidatus Kapabacteria bacterium]
MKKYPYLASVVLLACLVASCAKYMDNNQPGTLDSAARADSIHHAMMDMLAQKLLGVWIRRVTTGSGEQGFTMNADGRLTLIGNYTLHGDRWQIAGDTLILFEHSDQDSLPLPNYYRVAELTDSILSVTAFGSAANSQEMYHKRSVVIPKKYTEFFKQHFEGQLSAGQLMYHSFDVQTMFDGGITLTSDSGSVKFYLLKDDVNLTPDPVREWNGRFVPGSYKIRVMYIYQKPRQAERAQYSVIVEEK